MCRVFVDCGWICVYVCVWVWVYRCLDGIADFGAHALLHEGTELALIVDLDDLLRPIGRVGDVELHLDEVARSRR